MQADFILVAERRRDSTLRILRARVSDLTLHQHRNFASRRQFNRRPQSCDSGANDQKIGIRRSGWHDEMVYLKPARFYKRRHVGAAALAAYSIRARQPS